MGAIVGRQRKQKLRGEQSFEGGVNTGVSLFAISDNETMDETGFDFDEYPAAAVRKGRTRYGSAGSGKVRLLAPFGTAHMVRAVGGVLSYNSSGTTWTQIATGLADADWSWTNFNDKLILTNGTDNVKVWDGNTLSDLNASDAPKGKFIASSLTRVYIAHDGDQISFSAFQDETDWTSPENSGTDQFYTPNGGEITALTFFRDQVTAFKRDAMAVYYGNNYYNQQLVTVSNDIGCVSAKTVVEVGEVLIWLGENNVYAYSGGLPQPIGDRIRGYLNRINRAAESRCTAFTDGLRYYLCLCLDNAQEPNLRLVYDTRYARWRVCAQNEQYTYGVRFKNVVYAGDANGQIWKPVDGDTDDGSPIPWSLTTGPKDEGWPEAEKTYLELHLQGEFRTGTTLKTWISTTDQGENFVEVPYDPTTAADYGQNRNVLIPLDTVPMTHKARFRLSGTGRVKIERMQRYFRVQRIQR